MHIAYRRAVKALLIKPTGEAFDADSLKRALTFEVNRRTREETT